MRCVWCDDADLPPRKVVSAFANGDCALDHEPNNEHRAKKQGEWIEELVDLGGY